MNMNINQTADAIVALINSRPASPTKTEIAAVIARHMASPASPFVSQLGDAIEVYRTTWTKLVAELRAKAELLGRADPDDPSTDALEAAVAAADDRVITFEDDVTAVLRGMRASTFDDLAMLADFLFRRAYAPEGATKLRDPASDALLDGGTVGSHGVIDDAMGVLLKAIRDLTPGPWSRLDATREIRDI
jgi:hypothetical protein